MSLILGIFGDAMSTLKTILAMCLVLGVIYLLITIPQLRPIVAIVFAVVFVFCGFSALYHDIVYLSTNNTTIGQVLNSYVNSTKATQSEEDKAEWKLNNLGFSQSDGNEYESTIILDPCKCIDLEKNQYALFVNNDQCLSNEVGADYVRSKYSYTFYDKDGTKMLSDTLHIYFAFSANETKLVLKTNGGQSAVSLWRAFQAKNNFILSLKAISNSISAETTLNIISGPYAIYDFDNGTLNGFTVDVNQTFVNVLTLPQTIAGMELTTINQNAFQGLDSTSINYDGTAEEFRNISKSTNWNATSDANFIVNVVCNDSTITYDCYGYEDIIPDGIYNVSFTYVYNHFNGMSFTTSELNVEMNFEIKNNQAKLLDDTGEILVYDHYVDTTYDGSTGEILSEETIAVPRAFMYKFVNESTTYTVLIGYNTKLSENFSFKEGWNIESYLALDTIKEFKFTKSN